MPTIVQFLKSTKFDKSINFFKKIFKKIILKVSQFPQKLQLIGRVFPRVCVFWRRFRVGDGGPFFGQAAIERHPLLTPRFCVGLNGFGGTLRDAHAAIDAGLWINHQHVGAFFKTIDRAHHHTFGVLTIHTSIRHNVGHRFALTHPHIKS